MSPSDYPTPPALLPGGDADPDRQAPSTPADLEDGDSDRPGPEPEDGAYDTEESFARYVAYCERADMMACLYPSGRSTTT